MCRISGGWHLMLISLGLLQRIHNREEVRPSPMIFFFFFFVAEANMVKQNQTAPTGVLGLCSPDSGQISKTCLFKP